MPQAATKLRAMGLATRTRLTDRTRVVWSRARSINANLRNRTDDKVAVVKRINGELAVVAERLARQADAVVRNARRSCAPPVIRRRAWPERRSMISSALPR
jgi:hypothetical protein